MAKKKSTVDNLILNRRARFDYTLHDHFNVGIILTGAEVKAVRTGRVDLKGSYVTVKDNEIWLTNASFSLIKTAPGQHETVIETGSHKLLAKRKEVDQLIAAKDQGMTIVPLSMTTKTPYIKLEIATAKGKKLYDKREAIKRRDLERENKTLLKRL